MSCRRTVNPLAFNYLLPAPRFITASYADQHKTTDGSAQDQRINNYSNYIRNAHEKCGLGQQENIPAGCSKWHPSKAAGESKPEAYPQGYVEDFDEPRTKLGDIFSTLLRASLGRRDGLLKDRAEAEVGNGIFEVGIEPLEGSHVRVGDIFHREGDPFFPLAEGSHRMPEFVSVEDNEIAWLCDQLKMFGLFHRVVLE